MLYRNTFKKIKKSLGRYLSLMMIVFVGVGFYAGIEVTAPSLRNSAHNYYIDHSLFDLKIISTLGLTDSDISALEKIENVEFAIGSRTADVLVNENVLRIHELDSEMNTITLSEGRLPKDKNELVGDSRYFSLGETLYIQDNEMLNTNTYTIVGLTQSVLYISDEYGSSTLGNGIVNRFAFAMEDAFILEEYSEIYLRVKGSDEHYTSEYYNQIIDDIEAQLVTVRETQILQRWNSLREEGLTEIQKNQQDLNVEIEKATVEFENAWSEINANELKLQSGWDQLNQQQSHLDEQYKQQTNIFNNSQAEIDQGYLQLRDSLKMLESSPETLVQDIKQTETTLIDLNNQLANMVETDLGYYEILERVQGLNVKLATMKQIQIGLENLESSQKELNEGIKLFKDSIKDAQSKIDQARSELRLNSYNLTNAKETLKQSEADYNQEIFDAQSKIDEALIKIETLEKPKWHILTRDTIGAYKEFESSVDVISTIAQVFPIFFILISLLMTSNSMSRMVNEERSEIGALTSLGYTNTQISLTYCLYALSVSIIGVLFGFIVGSLTIPPLIFTTFGNFIIPKPQITFNYSVLFASMIIACTVLVGVALKATSKTLNTTPAALLRPLPPKHGKVNILERLPLIWNRLSFNWKVTFRNIFRYKKRALMTLIGVSGCTALLLVGFGLRDSIKGIETVQYKEIFKYSTLVTFDDSISEGDVEILEVLAEFDIKDYMVIHQDPVTLKSSNSQIDAYRITPLDSDKLNRYFGLRNPENGEEIDHVNKTLVSYKLMDILNISSGDTITLIDGDYSEKSIKIDGRFENYISHFIFMSPENNNNLSYNSIVLSHSLEDTDALSHALVNKLNAINITHSDVLAQAIRDTNASLDGVIVLIVAIAALLALVVLYNLTSINISERMREIATLKVLGFSDKEANNYIYREANLLSILSIFVGLVLGKILHKYVLTVVEGTGMMFFNSINVKSYLLSFFITLIILRIMQFITFKVIQTINMIEALKSVE